MGPNWASTAWSGAWASAPSPTSGARDTVERRDVALKIAAPEISARFGRDSIEQEARIAASLDHPNIVAVRNADWIGGYFVIATDLARKSLAEYAGARRSTETGLRVVRDVAAGLAHAHRHRILHRDVKPENIMIFADRRAALGDFGLARFAPGASRAYTEAGTLGYMAPEQAYGRPRYASDVFSLGLIAYKLLTGRLPTWPFEWPYEGHARLARRVPKPYHSLLRRATRIDPDQRYADAGGFARALERAARRAAAGVEGRPRRPPPRRAERSPFGIAVNLFQRRCGRALELRYDCFRCGGPISEAMRYCPWCGTGENSLIEVSVYPLVCPECERGVRPEWTSCPWCYAGRMQGNGRRPRRDPRAARSCAAAGCDGELRAFMRYCPRCKTRPGRAWSHPDLPARCPRCRWPVAPEFWHFCAWCGRRDPGTGAVPRPKR